MPDNDLQAGLDSFLAKESEFKATTLRNNWANTSGTSPDDFAKQIALSRATGIPAQSLAADPEEARRHETLQGTDFTGLVTSAPKTTNFLLDPKNAGLYRDKVPELSALEGVLTSFKRGLTSGLRASDASSILESIEIIDAATALEGGDKSVLTGKYGSLFAGVGGSPEAVKRRLVEAQANYRENLVEYARRTKELKKLPMTPEFEAFSRSEGVRGTLGTFANAPFTVTAQLMAQSTGQLLPVMPLMIGGGLAGGVRGLMAGTGGGSFLTGFQADISGELDKRKIDLGDPAAVSALSADPEFKKVVQRAFVKNVIIGGFDAATAGIAGGVRLAKSGGRNLAAQTGVQMAGGAGGEVAGSALSGQGVSFNAAFSEAIAELPGGVFDASIIAASRYIGTEAQGAEAQINAAKLTEMFAATAQVHDRDPETFKQFFQTIAPDATVLIAPDKLQEVLLQADIDPAKLPSFTEQASTSQAGAGIEIPVHELIAAFAGTGAEAALIPHVRFGADMPTLAESREAGTKAADFFQKEADRILEEQSRNEEFVAGAKAVQDDIKAQILALNRRDIGPQAAAGYATLTGAFYTTMASQLGVTPLQLRDGWTDAQGVARKGYKLTIGGEQNVNAAQSLNQLEPATRDTFTGAGIPNLLKTDNWTILTAENPNAQKLSPKENAARNAELQRYLTAQGYEFTPVKGHYGQPENSFVVTGISPEQAQALAKKFEQESALTRHGLVYQDGSITPSNGLTVHPSQPADFYTTLPDGTHFTVGLDFEAPRGKLSDVLNQTARDFQTVTPAQIDAIRKSVAWTETGTENGFPIWKNAQVALTSPVDVTEGHDVFYKPLGNERAVRYQIQDANGRSVGYTVLELADGWPTLLLDIEVTETERGKRYAEQTVAAIANDAGELGIWHIVPSARSWWERIGAAPVDEHNGTIDFNGYADARASRENQKGVGEVAFNQSRNYSGLFVKQTAVEEKTGKKVTYKTDAQEAMDDVDARIKFAEELKLCLAS